MVSRLMLEAIARRYDTTMSAAMLRALGARPNGRRAPRFRRRPGSADAYRDLRGCFENRPEFRAYRGRRA